MRENEEISQAYCQEAHQSRTLNSVVSDVLCYRGLGKDPRWTDVNPGTLFYGSRGIIRRTHLTTHILSTELYTPLCTIFADTSKVARFPQEGPNGTFYVQKFKIVLLCGLTELRAQISWTENVRFCVQIQLS